MVTLLDHTARTRRTSSATSTPRRTLARSPSRSARRLLLMDIMVVMEAITSTCIFYIRDLKINEKNTL